MNGLGATRAGVPDDGKGFAILPVPSPGRLFTVSDGYKAIRERMPKADVRYSMKATFAEGTAKTYAFVGQDANPKRPLYLMIQDVIPTSGIDGNGVSYLRQATPAANTGKIFIPEGTQKAVLAATFVPATSPVEKYGFTQKVTDELYTDAAGLSGFIDNYLLYQLAIQVDNGILNYITVDAGVTIPATAGTGLDGISEGIGAVRNNGGEPDAVVISSVDFAKLQKSPSANQFMYDEATELLVPRLYGVPVVFNQSTAGFAWVCCFNMGAQAFFKQEISLDSTNSSDDDFVKNLIALRAEARVAVAVYNPNLFAKVALP